MDFYKYIVLYQIPNFSLKNLNKFYLEFEKDFVNEVVNISVGISPFDHLKKSVGVAIGLLIKLNEISHGILPVDIIWRTLFMRKIQPWTIKYYSFAIDDSFFQLQNYFNPNKCGLSTDVKQQPELTTNDEYMSFMGLYKGFTKADLTRRYRQLCLLFHPDKGGMASMFIKLQKAKAELAKIAK